VEKRTASSEKELVGDDESEERCIAAGEMAGDEIGLWSCICGGGMNSTGYCHGVGAACTMLAFRGLGTYATGGMPPRLI
jgi:hypothetical protein